jgi:GH3 auxin-responsive promoter
VSSIWEAAQRSCAAVVRRTTEALLRARNRRLLSHLDQTDPVRAQLRVLLGLLNQGRTTRFGVEHDFRRIHTIDDYCRLVPLTTRADLWRNYWEPALPRIAGATWPALPSAALQAANIAALRTAFAFVVQARPRLRLLDGRIAWLGEDIALSPEAAPPTPRAKDVFGSACLPWEVRPYSAAVPQPTTPLTCMGGSMRRLLTLFEQVKRSTGRARVQEVWPQLAVVFYSRRLIDPDAAVLRAELGDGVLLLEIAALREGILAVEDPRYGRLRLLPDQGVYFEFVPTAAAKQPAPPRFGLDRIEVGVPYELVLTSAAGVWACRAGVSVQFERREPALFSFVETPLTQESLPIEAVALPQPVTAPPSHRRSGDIPAARPESFVHSPWLIPADRG